MEFQIIDWFCRDEPANRLVGDNTINTTYVIHIFGVNAKGESIHVKVNNFKPYFFIKVPKFFKKHHVDVFYEYIKKKIYFQHVENIANCQLQKRMDFNGYHREQDKFVVVHFTNKGAFDSLKRIFKDGQHTTTIREITSTPIKFSTYEAGLDPLLRFIHIANIQPAGWVTIDKFKVSHKATTQIDIETEWTHVHPYDNESVAPIKQASFDIECTSGDGTSFPEPHNPDDKIIQIGTTVYIYGQNNDTPFKHIICLKQTDPIQGAIVESYETEEEVLLAWTKLIQKIDPDIITGYNIYGFDFRYLYQRAELLGITDKFCRLGRLKGEKSELYEKKLSSSALGFNQMYILPMIGRLEIDLFKVIQRDYNFESYKLDAVSAEFIKGKIRGFKQTKTYTHLVADTKGLEVGNYISILVNKYKHVINGKSKFKIIDMKDDRIRIEKIEKPFGHNFQWCLAKDDVSPKDIFKMQLGSSADRSIVAKYCLMDNILCNQLMDKLDIIVNHMGMANVCFVPMSFLFLRGQGIKAYSLVARQCRLDKYVIPDLRKSSTDSEYQGATVLEARAGGHFEPVACNDFASLYPSSMISHNLSPDTLIIKEMDKKELSYETINVGPNQIYHFVKPEETSEEDTHNAEVQKNRKGRGILPRILIHLLQSRKDVKKRMANETDPFKKSLLDGLQLSYKLTCNSIYGQCGSPFSSIACKPVASACTSVGRQLLEFAGKRALEIFPGSELVYGDTDSCMVKYPVSGETKSEKLQHAIQCAKKVEQIVSNQLPWPHNFEYEKTYYPYILYSKKRYSGVMYEFDTENHTKVDNKGIVLKRRDNAKIVKYIFGGCLDIILFEQNVEKALGFMHECIEKMFRGEFDINMFVISKALKVTKTTPAHKMLADRITIRDPGNAPQLNDRIPYVYVSIDKEKTKQMLMEYNKDIVEKTKKRKKLLQGDLIEHPQYVQDHDLPIDYLFYLTNQLTNPLTQLFGIFENVDGDVEIKEKAFKQRVIKPLEKKYKNKQCGIQTLDMFFKKN